MKCICCLITLLSISLQLSAQNTFHVEISPQEDEAFATAHYTLWIPEGLDRVKRIILHQHGCGEGAQTAGQTATDDLHWRLLAVKTESALMGSSLWPKDQCPDWCDPNNGTERAYLEALDMLAKASDHPEVVTAKWIIWGHSGGGYWNQMMLQKHPERFEAIVLQSAGFREREARDTEMQNVPYVSDVPMLIHVGIEEKGHERFSALYDDGVRVFDLMRQKEAPVTLVIDPATGHGSGDTRYLTIPWIEAVLQHDRDQEVIRKSEHSKQGNWFPHQILAAKWDAFTQIGTVPDFTPPKLSPINVKAMQTKQGMLITWDAMPDWESGIMTFRVYRNGEVLPEYQTPDRNEGQYTHYYRKPNYSDTPSRPLSEMQYVDKEIVEGESYEYSISFLNWAGLESYQSSPVRVLVK